MTKTQKEIIQALEEGAVLKRDLIGGTRSGDSRYRLTGAGYYRRVTSATFDCIRHRLAPAGFRGVWVLKDETSPEETKEAGTQSAREAS